MNELEAQPNLARWIFAQRCMTLGYAVLILGAILFGFDTMPSFVTMAIGFAIALLGAMNGAMCGRDWNRRFLAFCAGGGAIVLAAVAAWILVNAGYAKAGHLTFWTEGRIHPNWPMGSGALVAQMIFIGMWRELSLGADQAYKGPSQILLTFMLVLGLPIGLLLGHFI